MRPTLMCLRAGLAWSLWLAWLSVAAACGGSAQPGAREPAQARDAQGQAGDAEARGETASAHGGARGAGAARPGPAQAPSEAECQALLAHVVALASAAHAQTVTPELTPTEEQLADIRAQLAPEFMPACLALDRASFECELRAQSKDALLACAGQAP